MLTGRSTLRSTAWIASIAWPSDMSGARLNEIVTAGCCDWRLICSGPTVRLIVATSSSGTSWPVGVATRMRPSAVGVVLELVARLQDHLVVVGLGEDGRDLAGAEGVVERGAHLVGGDAERRRLFAVDVDPPSAGWRSADRC